MKTGRRILLFSALSCLSAFARAEVPFYHTLLNVPEMHAQGITGKGVRVGVVDAGNHLRTVVSIINSKEFGIAPDCDLQFVDTSTGDLKKDIPLTIKGLWWCATNGCRVINMSFGYPPGLYSDEHRKRLDEELLRIRKQTGVIFIAGIGNNNLNELPYCPQDIDVPICIGGLDKELNPGELTDSWRKDFCAFGIDVPALSHGKAAKVSGTSFAAPMATALAALLLQQEPSLTQDEIYEIFKSSCRKLAPARTREFGWGLLQACKVPKDYRRQRDIDAAKSAHVRLERAEILNKEATKLPDGAYMITLNEGESLTLETAVYPANASDPKIYWYRGNIPFLNPVADDGTVTAVKDREKTVSLNGNPMKFTRPPLVTYVAFNSDFERIAELRVKILPEVK